MIKINTDRLPSQGKLGKTEITIDYIVNSKMTQLSLALGNTKNDLEKYYKNFKLLLASVTGWENAPLFDLYPILFFSKSYNFLTEDIMELNAGCPNCGKSFSFNINLDSDIEYPNISEQLLKIRSIKLGGHEFPITIPTIKDFFDTIEYLLPFSENFSINEIIFLTYFDFKNKANLIVEKVNNAVKEEIILIHELKSMMLCVPRLSKSIPCSHCSKEVVIADITNIVITNPFRDLRKYCRFPENLIIYK